MDFPVVIILIIYNRTITSTITLWDSPQRIVQKAKDCSKVLSQPDWRPSKHMQLMGHTSGLSRKRLPSSKILIDHRPLIPKGNPEICHKIPC